MSACPICGEPIPEKARFTCTVCWFEKVPAYDRRMLGTMLANGQPVESKLAAVVRRVKKIWRLSAEKKKGNA